MKSLHHTLSGGSLAIAAFLHASSALAWGPEGHAIVAEIAEARLTPGAATAAASLLQLEGHQHLDQVASWADDDRVHDRRTGPWHFAEIPMTASRFDRGRDCAGGNCVVGAIQHFAQVLGDQVARPIDRLEALKFVIHFVGDIAQPLHCADNGDNDGNDVRLTYLGRHTSLHAVWDGAIIEAELGSRLGPNFAPDLSRTEGEARALTAAIGGDIARQWAPDHLVPQLSAATVEWANESHQLATGAYDQLPASRSRGWEQRYNAAAWPVIQTQLAKSGVRLAEVLNEELGRGAISGSLR